MQLLFVINPGSGAGQYDWKATIDQWLTDRPYPCSFFILQKDGDNATMLHEQIEKCKPERVVVAGGDGTLKMVAEILVSKDISMAIIPAGSANGLARELDIPADPEKALELAVTGHPVQTDMIRINDEWCIHLADMGLNARMIKYFEQVERRGLLGYLQALLKSRGLHTFMRLTIKTEEKQLHCKALMAVIANATKYGTGAVINPAGKMNDGLFELVIVRRLPLSALLNMLLLGKPFKPSNIEIISCRSVTINSTRKYPFQVDGEFRGQQNHITAEIRPSVLKVIMKKREE